MILGLGTDIVEVSRIQDSLERFGERFLNRVLRPEEIAYCMAHANPAPHIAARFAAKEAIAKAFGTGIGAELGWLDIEIARHPSGEPHVIINQAGVGILAQRGAAKVLITLSHTENYATATALLIG